MSFLERIFETEFKRNLILNFEDAALVLLQLRKKRNTKVDVCVNKQ